VANGVVYFGTIDGYVYALNASTGAKLWSTIIADGVYSSPAVANGVVFISGSSSVENTLHALNANTGAQLWSSKVGPNEGTVALANGVVYVCSEFDGMVYALNANTGTKQSVRRRWMLRRLRNGLLAIACLSHPADPVGLLKRVTHYL